MKELLQLAGAAGAHGVPGTLVLVGNEIGLGVLSIGREVPAFVDVLARLNQEMSAAAGRLLAMHIATIRGDAAPPAFTRRLSPHLPPTPPDTPK